MRKFSWSLVIVLLASLVFAACAAPVAAPTAPAAESAGGEAAGGGAAAPLRIAIIMPSSITDVAWSQSMYTGLKAVQAEMGGEAAMQISYTENMFNVADAATAIRDYAVDGNDIVIAHGTQYGNAMFDVAVEFPETTFAWGTAIDTGADKGLSNVFAYEAQAQEGGYVNGVIAALMGDSDTIGVVGPVEAGDAKLYIDGFVEGVKATKPDMQVNVSYTGSFGDTALAAEAANTHIKAGAKVLTGSAQQVVGAIGVAAENGVYWLGTQSDQSPLAPEWVVANQLYDWTGVIKDMIAKREAGTVGGTAYSLTLNDGLVIQFNDQAPIPDEVRAAAEKAIEDIKSGAITPLK
ncbi:BMP family protein [Caldilinea sp.]|uniref:BMP family protein n=1 Tax=Caldilinea sp. TaxID=2293560 RepID=UPI002CDEBC56|nr:BMP family protein [Anaerolineales bacterium]HQY91991.1 BMP family protein [Caldilinea sp.]HRA65914.1 BMP family protein [Caldilinea sp.]